MKTTSLFCPETQAKADSPLVTPPKAPNPSDLTAHLIETATAMNRAFALTDQLDRESKQRWNILTEGKEAK